MRLLSRLSRKNKAGVREKSECTLLLPRMQWRTIRKAGKYVRISCFSVSVRKQLWRPFSKSNIFAGLVFRYLRSKVSDYGEILLVLRASRGNRPPLADSLMVVWTPNRRRRRRVAGLHIETKNSLRSGLLVAGKATRGRALK